MVAVKLHRDFLVLLLVAIYVDISQGQINWRPFQNVQNRPWRPLRPIIQAIVPSNLRPSTTSKPTTATSITSNITSSVITSNASISVGTNTSITSNGGSIIKENSTTYNVEEIVTLKPGLSSILVPIKPPQASSLFNPEEELNQLGDAQYYFSNERRHWFEADRFCRRLNLELVNFETKREHDMVAYQILNMKLLNSSDILWTGGTDMASHGDFYWSNTGLPLSFSAWAPFELQGKPEDHCLAIMNLNNREIRWRRADCATKALFICQRTRPLASSGEGQEVTQQTTKRPVTLSSKRPTKRPKPTKRPSTTTPVQSPSTTSPFSTQSPSTILSIQSSSSSDSPSSTQSPSTTLSMQSSSSSGNPSSTQSPFNLIVTESPFFSTTKVPSTPILITEPSPSPISIAQGPPSSESPSSTTENLPSRPIIITRRPSTSRPTQSPPSSESPSSTTENLPSRPIIITRRPPISRPTQSPPSSESPNLSESSILTERPLPLTTSQRPSVPIIATRAPQPTSSPSTQTPFQTSTNDDLEVESGLIERDNELVDAVRKPGEHFFNSTDDLEIAAPPSNQESVDVDSNEQILSPHVEQPEENNNNLEQSSPDSICYSCVSENKDIPVYIYRRN